MSDDSRFPTDPSNQNRQVEQSTSQQPPFTASPRSTSRDQRYSRSGSPAMVPAGSTPRSNGLGERSDSPSGSEYRNRDSRRESRLVPGGGDYSGDERSRRMPRAVEGGGGGGFEGLAPIRTSLMPQAGAGGPRSAGSNASPTGSPRNSLHSHQFSSQQQQQQQSPYHQQQYSNTSHPPTHSPNSSPNSAYPPGPLPVGDHNRRSSSSSSPSPSTNSPQRFSRIPPLPNRSNSNNSNSSQHDSAPPSSGGEHSSNNGNGNSRIITNNTAPLAPYNGGGSGGQACAKCELPMTGQFVRALGTVYHLDCFRCQDCNKVVASKFFPVDDPNGKPYPLCETDYFRRLGLLCSKCGAALRGSYITALDMKFHVEHFTCSVCPTVFGPQDSYYEHAGSVYCHFHYSTRFAVKCTGCRTAILKQFVEINRNSTDEHWHPECYMIHKFWNIKLAPSPAIKAIEPPADLNSSTSTSISIASTPDTTRPVESSRDATGPPSRALLEEEYLAQEQSESPASLKERQKQMEEQVYRIWTVLSLFEESSAACISEMLRHVSSGHYIEGVRMAEKFVLHVETLFSAIDDLSLQFKTAGAKEISHVREARMLCKKVVNFFSLLSHTHETGARKMSITQELLSLVTGLAHYLKILIRIALTAALKLEREYLDMTAIGHFLNRLDRLARDPEASQLLNASSSSHHNLSSPTIANAGTQPNTTRAYGYQSLTRAVGTLVGQGEATTDLCEGCHLTVEEECARFGTSLRWHLPCLRCVKCGKAAGKESTKPTRQGSGDDGKDGADASATIAPTIRLQEFRIQSLNTEETSAASGSLGRGSGSKFRGGQTLCSDCANYGTPEGFEYVTRLEQYAFLLCVALNKLYALLKQRGVVPSSPQDNDEAIDRSLYDAYRDSTDIKRMKSLNIDRKLSSTRARIPKRSTIIQSPTGRVAQPTDLVSKPPIPSRNNQPQIDGARSNTVPRPTISTPAQSPPIASTSQGPSDSRRPQYSRTATAVRIVDDQPSTETQSSNHNHSHQREVRESALDEEGFGLLAHLPSTLETEQSREERRDQPVRAGMLLSELSALEYFIVKHVAALMLASDNSAFKDVAPLDELLEMIDARKNTFWGKLFKGGNEKKNIKKKGVFGIPLDVLVERNGADSMHGAGPGSLRVPSFVDDVISAMKQMDMSVEGVFRKNGNIRRLKDLSEALDRDPASVNLADENPVQLAALLKRFLRDLPDPLLTFKLFQLFIATQRVENLEERKKIMHLVCCLMPKFHRDTMEVVFVFLKWVASFSHVDEETGSKMDLQNLATVICPNILYSKGKDPYKDESFSAIRTLHELLEYQDEFYRVPEEFLSILNDDLFNNPAQLTSKEILARAENHVRSGKNRVGTTTRGEIHTQRPDLQQAWSAPSVGSRTGSGFNAGPNASRGPTERPVSFSTFAPNPANLPSTMRQPQPMRPPAPGNPYLNPEYLHSQQQLHPSSPPRRYSPISQQAASEANPYHRMTESDDSRGLSQQQLPIHR